MGGERVVRYFERLDKLRNLAQFARVYFNTAQHYSLLKLNRPSYLTIWDSFEINT